MKIGIIVFGVASAVAGILDLVWSELEPADEPLQAWGHVPGMTIIAYVAAIWLIAGGAAMLWPRSARFGAAALTILYGLFILFPLPRFYTAPHYLGYGVPVYIGVVGSVCGQIILAVAAAVAWESLGAPGLWSRKTALIARWGFGLCPIFFGLSHLTAVAMMVSEVPTWMPLGGPFWVVFTGIAFVLAGLGIVTGVLDVLAAWMLGVMLLIFSALESTPHIFLHPRNHVAWGGNAYNLTAVGAAWIFAGWLAVLRKQVPPPQSR